MSIIILVQSNSRHGADYIIVSITTATRLILLCSRRLQLKQRFSDSGLCALPFSHHPPQHRLMLAGHHPPNHRLMLAGLCFCLNSLSVINGPGDGGGKTASFIGVTHPCPTLSMLYTHDPHAAEEAYLAAITHLRTLSLL